MAGLRGWLVVAAITAIAAMAMTMAATRNHDAPTECDSQQSENQESFHIALPYLDPCTQQCVLMNRIKRSPEAIDNGSTFV